MSAHTPGRWHWDSDVMWTDEHGDHIRWRVTTMGKTITQVYRNDAHAEADSRLIAAAPDLLEALEHIVNAVAICTDDHGNRTAEICQKDDFRAARAAISKATGAA